MVQRQNPEARPVTVEVAMVTQSVGYCKQANANTPLSSLPLHLSVFAVFLFLLKEK